MRMIRRGRVLPTAAADARRTERIVECARSRGSGAGGGLLTKQLQKRAYHGCGGRFQVTEESVSRSVTRLSKATERLSTATE